MPWLLQIISVKMDLVILKLILLLAMMSAWLLLISEEGSSDFINDALACKKINLVISIMLMLEKNSSKPFFNLISADVFVHPGRGSYKNLSIHMKLERKLHPLGWALLGCGQVTSTNPLWCCSA